MSQPFVYVFKDSLLKLLCCVEVLWSVYLLVVSYALLKELDVTC